MNPTPHAGLPPAGKSYQAYEAPGGSRRYAVALIATLMLIAGWRFFALWHGEFELYADEAQYWSWALQPDWGYYSKPPMIAWAIGLSRYLFGDSEIGLRGISLLIYPLITWVVFLTVRRLYAAHPQRDSLAFWSAFTFATLPLASLGGMLITTDTVLLLFWSLALYFTVVATQSGLWRDWLLLGAALGLGLLSKYSMVFYGLGFFAWLALEPAQRKWLKNPRPYAAAALALLLLAPNLWWNAQHQFVSVHHTAEISQLDRGLINPGAFLEFFTGQFLVFGPLTFAGLILLLKQRRVWLWDSRLRFIAAFTFVPLAAFFSLALLSRAFANWAAFAYIGGSVLIAAAAGLRGQRRILVMALLVNLLIAAALYHGRDLIHALDLKPTYKRDPYHRITGYRALGQEVAKRLQAHPGTRLVSCDRKEYAWMRYYARPWSAEMRYLNPEGRIDNHYALTADLAASPQGRFLLVCRNQNEAALAGWFSQVTALPPIRLDLYPDYKPEYGVWLVEDYRVPAQ